MTGEFERWFMECRLKRLGEHWDKKLRTQWLMGTPAAVIAREYGLELETVEAIIPRRLTKRKAA